MTTFNERYEELEATQGTHGWDDRALTLARDLLAEVPVWRPIACIPVNTLALLRDSTTFPGEDIFDCHYAVGYLTDGGWFSVRGEMRAMAKNAFTEWMPLPPPPVPTGEKG